MIHSWFEQISLKKRAIRLKFFFFFICFWQLSPPFNANSESLPHFDHKKRVNRSKNQWANSQPCPDGTESLTLRISVSIRDRLQLCPNYKHNLCITVCFSLSRHLSVPRQSHTMLSNLGFTPSSPPPCAPDCINCIHKFRHPYTVLERSNSLSWFTLRYDPHFSNSHRVYVAILAPFLCQPS